MEPSSDHRSDHSHPGEHKSHIMILLNHLLLLLVIVISVVSGQWYPSSIIHNGATFVLNALHWGFYGPGINWTSSCPALEMAFLEANAILLIHTAEMSWILSKLLSVSPHIITTSGQVSDWWISERVLFMHENYPVWHWGYPMLWYYTAHHN